MDKSKFTLEERVKILEQEVAVLQEKIKELTECETVNKESRILYPIQIGLIASVLRPDEPNLPIQIDNQLRNYR